MRTFLGLDDPWTRPPLQRGWWRLDLAVAALIFLLAVVDLETQRSFIAARPGTNGLVVHPRWAQYLAVSLTCVALVARRRAPIATMLGVTGVAFIVTGNMLPEVATLFSMQIVYFLALYSAVAWARHRTWLVVAVTAVLLAMTGWVVYAIVADPSWQHVRTLPTTQGNLSPAVAMLVWTIMINLVYFAGAILIGQSSWSRARGQARIIDQNAQLARQGEELAANAVVNEKMRISRELHDVVAHHVSLIGIQAAAARVVLPHDVAQASEALTNIETASRQAVTEMRALLHTLRTDEDATDRAPVPSVANLGSLIDDNRAAGLDVTFTIVDPDGRLEALPVAVSATIYRTSQEALANVRTHSSASRATVVLRLRSTEAELEVTDNGRGLTGTGGTGYGQLGITERVQALGGQAEMGPRATGGYRVLIRLPLDEGR